MGRDARRFGDAVGVFSLRIRSVMHEVHERQPDQENHEPGADRGGIFAGVVRGNAGVTLGRSPTPIYTDGSLHGHGRGCARGRVSLAPTITFTRICHTPKVIHSYIYIHTPYDAVHFRVGEELRRADLRDGTLANEETVAKAPELLAVHWLFRGVD